MPNYISGRYASRLAACFLALWPAVTSAQTSGSGTVSLAGPASLTELLIPSTLEAFARDNDLLIRREVMGDTSFVLALTQQSTQEPVARFEIRVTDTARAYEALGAGTADMVVAQRPANEVETAVLGNRVGPPVKIARDALVAVVSRDNPLTTISRNALAGILRGEITDWGQLGAAAGPVRLNLLEPGTDQDQMIRAILTDEGGLVQGTRLHLSEAGIADAVAADASAIGITSFSETGNARALALGGVCGFSIPAGRLEIKNEDYPLTVPILLTRRTGDMPSVVGQYLAYLASTASQGPIRQAGFVDQMPEKVLLADQGQRLLNAISVSGTQVPPSELRRLGEVLAPLGRLSVSFRFLAGSNQLDETSTANVPRLAVDLMNGIYDGRMLTFVGFTDGVGSADQNLKVGRARAAAVEGLVRTAAKGLGEGRVTFRSEAFGEALPVACDDSEWGKQVNRRVEVWID